MSKHVLYFPTCISSESLINSLGVKSKENADLMSWLSFFRLLLDQDFF